MALGGLLLSTGLAAGLVWQSVQSRVTPYVVEVDRLGEARAVVPAATDYRPTDPQIAWHLGKFVANIRSRSLDPVLMRENWLSAYDFATERASLFLGEYARASDTSFQVKWTESEYERGSLASTSRWTAMLTVKVQSPRSAEVLRKNPLGLYVDAIDWSRELETATDRSATTPSDAVSPPAGIPPGSPRDPDLAVPDVAPIPERNIP